MAEPGFSIAAARPVVAGPVFASRVRRAVRLGASQNIMPVRSVSTAGYPSASLVDHCHDGKPMSHAVKLVDVIPDQSALRVMPWARADTVPRIDRVWALRAEVSSPGMVAGTHVGRQPLTDRVGSGETPQIGSFARAIACNEESHRSGLWTLRQAQPGAQQNDRDHANNSDCLSQVVLPFLITRMFKTFHRATAVRSSRHFGPIAPTSRSSLVSLARYTSPMTPWPIWAVT